jgi:CubicO group peptidase (beta-lactamase class C family)
VTRAVGPARGARCAAAAIVLVAASCSRFAPDPTAGALDRYLQRLTDTQGFNGVVVVADQGRIVYERAVGYADYARRTPNTADITFPLASISKLLTATGILQLAAAGSLRLGDPVARYLPGFPYPDLTVTHLLSHTSGLPPYDAYFDSLRAARPDRVFTNSDFLPRLVADPEPLRYRPGTAANYDNVNYIVLALIIGRVSGVSYEKYIEAHVLTPAGMRATRFVPFAEQFADTARSRFAFPHLWPHSYDGRPVRAGTVPYVLSYWKAYQFAGFGDWVSTTHDLLRFDAALSHGRLVPVAMLREAYTPVRLADGSVNPDRFGLGWEVEPDTSLGAVAYHSGAATGLSCVLLRNLSRRQTVIVFDNAHANAHQIGTAVLMILNGRQVPLPKRSAANAFGRVLARLGPEAARDTLAALLRDTVEYAVGEDELNTLGYDFLATDNPFHLALTPRLPEALEVFRTNVRLFPASWNVYDSYGEALLASGDTAEAFRMYQRSVEINPKSANGRTVLDRLEPWRRRRAR